MKKWCKTALYVFIALTSSSVLAWKTTITNKTDGQLLVQVSHCGDYIADCRPIEKLLNVNDQWEFGQGSGCCIKKIVFTAESGTVARQNIKKHKKYAYSPPSSGAGCSCRRNAITVKNAIEGRVYKLVAETR